MKPYFYLVATLFLWSSSTGYSQENQQFTLLNSEHTGIDFNNEVKDLKEDNILKYANFYGGAGVGVGDFNNDGLTDVYFAGNQVPDKLYLNRGDFKFEDVTEKAGITNDGGWSTGVTVADINNDGFLDIYVSRELYDHKPELRRNILYINQGDGTFKNEAKKYGVDDSERTRHATFFDYDNDGYLDLFVLTQPPNPGTYSEYFGTTLLKQEYTSKLFRNIGGFKFIDVTASAGLVKAGFPNAVSASDFNNDGWIDLFVANDFYAADFLYINQGDGTFVDHTKKAFNHISYYSMGVDVSDIDNDGNLDIFVLDMVAEDNFRLKRNMSGMNPDSFWKVVNDGGHYQYMFNNFHLNNGNTTFSEVAQLTNMAATDWSWANLIADFDNDGLKDIYITNGLLRDIRNTDGSKEVGYYVTKVANEYVKNNPNVGDISIWDILDIDEALKILPSEPLPNYMYKNNGNFDFSKVASSWGLDTKSFSHGAAYADFDNDGDLDIIVNNMNNEAFVYKNNSKNNFVRFKLRSTVNKPLFGTRLTLTVNGQHQIIESSNVRGIYSTSEAEIHFGLGKSDKVDQLHIKWMDGTETVLTDIEINKLNELIYEDVSKSSSNSNENGSEMQFFKDISGTKGLDYEHVENSFDDYQYQVLLPHKLSQFGPALAVGDINKDGFDDFYIGASAHFSGALFLQNSEGQFVKSDQEFFLEDRIHEDLDAQFFDVDNDNDLDLYIVSGGNEFEQGDKNYSDRLYLNDGKGNFQSSEKLSGTTISGSVVKTADFDNDGDLDLFIGGRLSPRNYPTPVSSKILLNTNGKLTESTATIAPELNEIGMVTDAIWSDYDSDSDLDLLIVGEWMPITIFENTNGNLRRKTFDTLIDTEGWWFSIEEGDFDNDGDMDYIVGNLGLNYKYKSSKSEPFDVYYDDFDKNGSYDIVLGYYNFGKHFPVRGFSCSSEQIPELKSEFKKYDLFASLDLNQIYGEKNLKKALYFKTHTFASVLIENRGEKGFLIHNLPVEAQFSSINDIIVEDINNDGHQDVILGGNLFVSEIETTRNDAGTGLILLGDGGLNFKPVRSANSGFFANQDVKKMKLIQVGNKKLLLVANNNTRMQVFELNN